jgi:four helix bundle protein
MGRIKGDLCERTLQFAISILNLSDSFPHSVKGWEIGKQLIRSGTSVGANVREADHAYTEADFAHRCNVARKEAGEAHYWLDLPRRAELLSGKAVDAALDESDQLTRILGAMVRATQERLAGGQ